MSRTGHRGARLASLAASLVLFVGAGSVRGDDLLAAAPPVIGGRGGLVEPPPTARPVATDETPATGARGPAIEHRSILLDLGSIRPPSRFDDEALVAEVAPESDSPGSIVRSYHGLESVAVRRILGYYRRFFSDELRDRWNLGDDSMLDIERRIERMAWAEQDLQAGGRWWERTWRQSLLPQLGGAPAEPRVVSIGSEIEVFRLGELALTNEGKLKVGRLSLYLDDDRIYERIEQRTREALFSSNRARVEANLARVTGPTDTNHQEKPAKALTSDENHLDVSVGILEDDATLDLERVLAGTTRERVRRPGSFYPTPRGNLLTGDGWNVSCRPNLQLRMPHSLGTIQNGISRAELDFAVRLYPGETRQLWGILNFKLSVSPRDRNDVTAIMSLDIVRW